MNKTGFLPQYIEHRTHLIYMQIQSDTDKPVDMANRADSIRANNGIIGQIVNRLMTMLFV